MLEKSRFEKEYTFYFFVRGWFEYHFVLVPGAPENIEVVEGSKTKNTIRLSWNPPSFNEVPLLFYYINITCISKEDGSITYRAQRGSIDEVIQHPATPATTVPPPDTNVTTTPPPPPPPPPRTTEVTGLPSFSTCSFKLREGAGVRPRWGLYGTLSRNIVIEESSKYINMNS